MYITLDFAISLLWICSRNLTHKPWTSLHTIMKNLNQPKFSSISRKWLYSGTSTQWNMLLFYKFKKIFMYYYRSVWWKKQITVNMNSMTPFYKTKLCNCMGVGKRLQRPILTSGSGGRIERERVYMLLHYLNFSLVFLL